MRLKKFLDDKKGIVMHPYTHVGLVAFILGLVLMYLIAKGTIPLPGFLAWLKP